MYSISTIHGIGMAAINNTIHGTRCAIGMPARAIDLAQGRSQQWGRGQRRSPPPSHEGLLPPPHANR